MEVAPTSELREKADQAVHGTSAKASRIGLSRGTNPTTGDMHAMAALPMQGRPQIALALVEHGGQHFATRPLTLT
jgi:hypothetical protein